MRSSTRWPAPLELLCLPAGVYLVLHFMWLMDDAFVYFRYVDNWVLLKWGLVFNRGEFVEGFTSPLWTLLLGLLRWTEASWWTIVRGLGVVTFLGSAAMLIPLQRAMTETTSVRINLPLLYFTFTYGALCSFGSGLETPLTQVVAIAFALFLARPDYRAPQILVGVAALVRPELLLSQIAAVVAGRVLHDRWNWTVVWTMVLSLGGWLVFRIWYYADLFPNTFYLKDEVWFGQGWHYLKNASLAYHVPWILLVSTLLLWRFREHSARTRVRMAMVIVAMPSLLYVVRVGGDFLHYRMLAFPLGLLICATSGILETALAGRRAWMGYALGLSVAALFFTARPFQLKALPWYLCQRPLNEDNKLDRKLGAYGGIEDALIHRAQPDLNFHPWRDGNAIELKDEFARYLRDNPDPEFSTYRTDYWCVRIYKHYDEYISHGLGLTSGILARIDVPAMRPGHRWLLVPFSHQVDKLYAHYGPRPDLFEQAGRDGQAPRWVLENLDTIRTLQRRYYNQHDFLENLRLALSFPPDIRVSADEMAWARKMMEPEIESDPPPAQRLPLDVPLSPE